MINILYDCPEQVEGMPKTEHGVFCQSCSKEVFDFRGMSEVEIKKIQLEQNVQCGIFDQPTTKRHTPSIIQNMFRAAFVAVFVLGMNASNLFGQTQIESDSAAVRQETRLELAFIEGTVSDHKGKPIQATLSYYLGDEIVYVETDELGNYRFELPKEMIGNYFYFDVVAEDKMGEFKEIKVLEAKSYIFNFRMQKYKPIRGGKTRGRMIAGKF